MFTGRKKGKPQLVLFSLDSFANRINWNFPLFRPVASHTRLWTQGQKAGPHLGPSLLSFGLDTGVEVYLPQKRKIPINPVCIRI